jgi:DNA polymerase-4
VKPFIFTKFPRAIIHLDGDSFFASCEVASRPHLKGKPVVTGRERGIASSMSYEAKARGITRAMPLNQIKRICPDAVILDSDYNNYSMYSKRMVSIVRKYTDHVDEYSIDECFADITHCTSTLKMSYEEIASVIQKELEHDLGITFSVGLSVNKVTAKIASKWKKPNGLTIIPGHDIHFYLEKLPVGELWGIGKSTARLLNSLGITTALEFAQCNENFVLNNVSKPYYEIWKELHGQYVLLLNTDPSRDDTKSISRTRTFTPPSSSRGFVFSQLSNNIENACLKLRRGGLVTHYISFYLKTQDMKYRGFELKLELPTIMPQVIIKRLEECFDTFFDPTESYRATGITLLNLRRAENVQIDLFGDVLALEETSSIYTSLDMIADKHGKDSLFLGSSLQAKLCRFQAGSTILEHQRYLFKKERKEKHLNIISLGKVR